VIEPETGEYFLSRTLTEAIRKAKEKYPGKVFYEIETLVYSWGFTLGNDSFL